jgi:hypothetical protein
MGTECGTYGLEASFPLGIDSRGRPEGTEAFINVRTQMQKFCEEKKLRLRHGRIEI